MTRDPNEFTPLGRFIFEHAWAYYILATLVWMKNIMQIFWIEAVIVFFACYGFFHLFFRIFL